LRTIGVTGGIGTERARIKILADLGAQIIDADVIARDVILKGMKRIRKLWTILDPKYFCRTEKLTEKSLPVRFLITKTNLRF